MAVSSLAGNAKTAKYLADPKFMQTLSMIQKNPQFANMAMQDPRMIECMGVLMGIDLQAFSGGDGDADKFASTFPSGSPSSPPPPSSSSHKPSSSSAPPPTYASSSSRQTTVSEDVPMEEASIEEEEDEEAAAEKKAKAAAEEQKKLGSEAYKRRDFPAAAAAFEKAWELWPKDVTFLTNLSAVYFEQGEYDKCIKTCETAVDEGRSLRADFKLIAKALGRTGSAYAKQGDLATAIKFFQKSLTEHRTPDVLNKLRDAERAKAGADAAAYVDPAQSAAAREEGNARFKAGDFAGAVQSYTESIRRDPADARGYNNRALCYTKLAALPEALKDAEEAIRRDPAFVKAYIRKSAVLFAMREYTKAIDAIQEAAEHDADGKNTAEIQQQMFKCNQALSSQRAGESEEETMARAMRDPEVAQIMNDPVMQQILQQAQQNPGALQDHMKNADVRVKIQKLVSAGIIKTR